jgi:hypothetical protein
VNGGFIKKGIMDTNKSDIQWLSEPEEHDYPAAESYLSLIYGDSVAAILVERLRKAPLSHYKAKDVLRASGLVLLGTGNAHVEHDEQKASAGKPLSPLLLVRATSNAKVLIADGYHRLSFAYSVDEDAMIPCKIAGVE